MKILSTKRFEELLQEINNLEKEVHLERRAKNKNQALLNDSLKKIKELENYLEFHEKKLKTLKTKHHTVNSKLGGYVTSCNNLRDQLKNVQEQYKQVKIENTRLRKLLDKKQDALSVKDAKIIWDQQIIELYKKKLNDYEQRLDNYKEEFKKCHVQKTINEYDKRLKRFLRREVRYLEEKLEEFILSLKEDEKSPATIKKYQSNIKCFLEFSKDMEINKSTIIAFKEKLDTVEEYMPNTTNNYLIVLNKFLKFIGKENLCVKIIRQQKKFSLDYSLSKKDYHRLLRTAKKYDQDDNYFILRILAETGIRVSELSFFKVENLSKTIKIRNKGKDREIPVKIDLLRDLRKYCRDHKIRSGLIIFNPKTGKGYANSTIWRRLKNIAGQARVNKNSVHPHAFRHYFAKCYLETYPNDIAGLADILGHNSLETTRIYTKLTNKEKELKIRNIKF